MVRDLFEAARRFARSLINGRSLRAALETALYAMGSGVLFYIVDVLLMRWQELSLG
ncbi:MAG: hypothetical protein HY521_01215 [Proteobacteria bacterium]|nr:hypothetical protein [Pseudomonadota bacterium]